MIQKLLKNLLRIFGLQYLLDIIIQKLKLPSALLLILVNLIPIIGVITFNWNIYDIILLYWVENIVVGIYNIPRIATGQGSNTIEGEWYSKIIITMFFAVHYFIFNFVHGIFLSALVYEKTTFNLNNDYKGVLAFFIALMISHGYSLITNYYMRGEYKVTIPVKQMFTPYPRVMIIHMTILIGAILLTFAPKILIIPFIILKTLVDLGFHVRAHTSKQEGLTDYNIKEEQINLILK